jgi:hypothetical protein
MSKHGADLALSLSKLLAVGRYDLPELAYDYTRLNRQVADAGDLDIAAFGNSSGSMATVYPQWARLRDHFQNILGQTADNLVAAGSAVVQIVRLYEDTDEVAKASIESTWRDGPPSSVAYAGDDPLPSVLPPVILK